MQVPEKSKVQMVALKQLLLLIFSMTLIQELNSFIVRYGLTPSRKLSQHFLNDGQVINSLIDAAELKPTDTVLEIGSGTGFLTRELLKKARKVIAVELDEKLCILLEKELLEEKLELIKGDYLALKMPEYDKVVSSPPYNISTKMMYKLFQEKFGLAVLLLQGEFVERITAEPGFYDYNALSVLTQYFTQPEIIKVIKSDSFYPRPESSSVIIKLVWRKRFGSAVEEEKFIRFIQEVFRYKNKNFSNALQLSFPFLKKDFKLKMERQDFKKITDGLPEEILTEKLSLLEVKELVKAWNYLGKKIN
jgi:16S rRNA (adenine1518-N6/adenine1519-N6)-dimethyltransferase